MPPPSIFREARFDLRLGQAAMARRLDISRSYLSELENGRREASPGLIQRLQTLAQSAAETLRRRPKPAAGFGIPVVSWAKAGVAASFEEIPPDWQKAVSSDCPDTRAFGLELEGDSMEPRYLDGDLVVVMPQTLPRPGSLVVANIESQGVIFKVFTPLPNRRVRLSSYNPAYGPVEVAERNLVWIYPVYEVRRQVWR